MTLLRRIGERASADPAGAAVVLLGDRNEVLEEVTYAELLEESEAVGENLHRVRAGKRILVGCSSGPSFATAFLGVLFSGRVPVATHRPGSSVDLRQPRRLAEIARAVESSDMLVDGSHEGTYDGVGRRIGRGLRLIRAAGGNACNEHIDGSSRSACYLQLTSGSTRTPLAVEVSDINVVTNIDAIVDAYRLPAGSSWVSWLPPHHDMGLITGLLGPLVHGCTSVVMRPEDFLKRPGAWLRAIGDYRAALSAAPNFAYDLCCRRIPEAEAERFDLSSWHAAVNGSEPVRVDTMVRFVSRFESAGFQASAFNPSYGLAEATLLVSCGPWKDVTAAQGGSECVRESAEPYGWVSCGRPAPGVEIIVVDPSTRRLRSEGETGEICVGGPGVALGYFKEPRVTAEVFERRTADVDTRYVRTGDLGFLRGGELFIVGRAKDVLTFRGRQVSAEEVEGVVQQFNEVRACAAVMVGSADIVVACEVGDSQMDSGTPEVRQKIARSIMSSCGVMVTDVLLVRKGWLPKTSSGKVRRGVCREQLEELGRGGTPSLV